MMLLNSRNFAPTLWPLSCIIFLQDDTGSLSSDSEEDLDLAGDPSVDVGLEDPAEEEQFGSDDNF